MAFAPLLIAGGASLLQAEQRKESGRITAQESRIAAGQIELGAVQREADRKDRLAKAMASQNAAAGAKGIAAFEGSPLSILEADIRAEETATERDIFQTNLAALTTRVRGQIAKSSAARGATIGLIGDFSKLAQTA